MSSFELNDSTVEENVKDAPRATVIDMGLSGYGYVYVPWIHGEDTYSTGEALVQRLAEHDTVTVVASTKAAVAARRILAVQNVVTERSGFVPAGAVVIAWCPTAKVMQRIIGSGARTVVLVEAPDRRYEAWAKLVGAFNVSTGEVMTAELNDAARAALDGVVDEGYNGWQNESDAVSTLAYLEDLWESGCYDRSIVVQHAELEERFHSIPRLGKILDQFEKAHATGSGFRESAR